MRPSSLHIKTLFRLALFLAFIFAHSALASSSDDPEKLQPSFSSKANLGFSIEQGSSTGFQNASGSALIMDFTGTLSPKVQIGLRSMGVGGRRDGASFYRLLAGPIIFYEIIKDTAVFCSLGFFQETATTENKLSYYEGRGKMSMVGWEKYLFMTDQLHLVLGGYLISHSGKVDTDISSTGSKNITARITRSHRGWSKGVEFGIKFII